MKRVAQFSNPTKHSYKTYINGQPVILKPGETIDVFSYCEAIEAVVRMTLYTPGQTTDGPPVPVNELNAGFLAKAERLKDEGCLYSINNKQGIDGEGSGGVPADGDITDEDSGDKQGAQRRKALTEAEPRETIDSKFYLEGSESYSPSDSELQKLPEGYPFSEDETQDSSEGGDPVQLFRGTFYIQETDLSVPNTILPLSLIRAYKSGHPYAGPFAWNWDHNHNIYLRELEPDSGQSLGSVARWNGNLKEDIFAWNEGGAEFVSPRGVFQKMEKGGVGDPYDYIVHDVAGVKWYFNRPAGWTNQYRIPLEKVVDRLGNTLEYQYDVENRLEYVRCIPVNNIGAPVAAPYHFLKFEYGDCSLLESVSDSVGRVVQYWHDPDVQRLCRVVFPATTDHPDGTQKVYHYGGLHLPDMLRNNILRVEDGLGKIYVENLYDEDPSSWSYGRVLTQVHGGHAYQFRYTQLQWLPPLDEYVNYPSQRTEIVDPEGGLSTYTFNFRGDILDRRTRLSKDGSYWITATEFEYDTQGNTIRTQHLKSFNETPEGTIVHVYGRGEAREYDPDNADPLMRGLLKRVQLLDELQAPKTVWEGTYDPALQLLLTERGPVGDGYSASDVTTTYEYSLDNKGKLIKISHPDVDLPVSPLQTQSSETQFEVNERGQTTAVITGEGIRNELVYDESPGGLSVGRLTKSISDAGTGGIAAKEVYTYDSYGFIKTVADHSGSITTYEHNQRGQIEKITYPEINGDSPTSIMHYDADGLVVEVERPRGDYADNTISGEHIVDRMVRNVLGHVTRSVIGANTEQPRITERIVDHRGLAKRSVDPLGTISRWHWDERGFLFRHEVEGYDGAESYQQFVYQRDGLIDQEIYGVAKDTLVEYEYEPFGRVKRVRRFHRATDGTKTENGATTVNYWSERGNLERIELREPPGGDTDTLLSRTEFEYDQRGHRIREIERPFDSDTPFDDGTTPRLVTAYHYDRDDRLVKVVDHRGGETTYTYDGVGRLTEELGPLGNKTTYTYDLVNRTVEIELHDIETDGVTIKKRKWTQKTDERGRLIEALEPDGAKVTYEYDDRDLNVAVVHRDGVRREQKYGLLNELLTDTIDPAGENLVNEWQYDLAGRAIKYIDPSGQETAYSYDGIGRLISSQLPGESSSRTLTYGADGRLQARTMPSGITLQYAYDNAGRLATMSATGVPTGVDTIPQHSYTYDSRDQLLSASAGGTTVSRAYDSFGRLRKETTHGDMLEATYNDLAGTLVRKWSDGRQETLTTNLNGVVTKIERTATGTLGAGRAVLGEFTPYGIGALGKAQYFVDSGAPTTHFVETTAEYDERKRVKKLEHVAGATTLESVEYRYDTLDRRRVEMLGSGTVQARLHSFDKRDRLTQTEEDANTFALNNGVYTQADHDADITAVETALASLTPSKYEYVFTTANGGKADERLTFKKTPAGGATATTAYSYENGHRLDLAGAENVDHHPDGTRKQSGIGQYDIDALGRVVRAKSPSGTNTRIALEYDPLGRVGSILPGAGTARKLSYFGDQVWQEKEGTSVVRQISRHPMVPGPVAMHVAGESYLTLHDARLNLLSVADSTGTVGGTDSVRYEPFGSPSTQATGSGIEPRFGGMRWLKEANVFLSDTRLMDPRHGAWLAQDPLGYVDSPNLYTYAAQNPIDNVDPSGLATGKGGVSANSDGGTGPYTSPAGGGNGFGPSGTGFGRGSTGGGRRKNGQGSGSSKRALFQGSGAPDGYKIPFPEWVLDTADVLRDVGEFLREGFGRYMDFKYGQHGVVGEFIAGAGKRAFDIGLMATPFGMDSLAEEAYGMTVFGGMVFDAMFSPFPEDYERLGTTIRAMPDYFAHASAGEWGSISADLGLSLATGGGGAVRSVAQMGSRLSRRLVKLVKNMTGIGRTTVQGPVIRAPIFADTDLLVAAQRGHSGALAEIRSGKTYVTPNQNKEFLAGGRHRKKFMKSEGIEIYSGAKAGNIAQTDEFQDIFKMIKTTTHGRNDAALVAFAKSTGHEAVTMERRLFNYITQTIQRPDIPIRRVHP